MIQPENGIAPPAPDEPTRTDSDTSELTDTDNSAAANQTQAEKRWADLFKKAEVEKPVIEDKTKYVVFAPHILAIMKTLEDMKKQLVKLTTTCEEQQVVIANQSDMLREIHSKLTVANTGVEENKAPDSDLHPLQLDADAKKQRRSIFPTRATRNPRFGPYGPGEQFAPGCPRTAFLHTASPQGLVYRACRLRRTCGFPQRRSGG